MPLVCVYSGVKESGIIVLALRARATMKGAYNIYFHPFSAARTPFNYRELAHFCRERLTG